MLINEYPAEKRKPDAPSNFLLWSRLVREVRWVFTLTEFLHAPEDVAAVADGYASSSQSMAVCLPEGVPAADFELRLGAASE